MHKQNTNLLCGWNKHLSVLVEDVPEASEKAAKLKYVSCTVLVEVPKDHSYYHIEHWFPGDAATVRVDFIVFWPVAKIYKDNEFSIHNVVHFDAGWYVCVFILNNSWASRLNSIKAAMLYRISK